MMAPAAFRRHLERGGEPPPPFFFFFFLDLLPGWEKGFPYCPWLPWRERGESPSEIGSISLSLSVFAFFDSVVAPFFLYPEIRNSDWIETFAQIFFQKLAFLCPKKGRNRLLFNHVFSIIKQSCLFKTTWPKKVIPTKSYSLAMLHVHHTKYSNHAQPR